MRHVRRLILAILILALVSYIAWDQVETRGLRRDIAAIAARGEPVTTEDPESAVLTTEQRDAARIYAAAVERRVRSQRASRGNRRAGGRALPPRQWWGHTGIAPDLGPRLPARRTVGSVSGKSLVYTRGSDGYRVYSVDNNRTDDGGVFYGVGSRGQMVPRGGAPRDFGVYVPIPLTR